jgi:3-dehydroquinate synthase
VTNLNIYNLYGLRIKQYFDYHGIDLKIHTTKIGEKAKTMPTLLSIVDSMNEFGDRSQSSFYALAAPGE